MQVTQNSGYGESYFLTSNLFFDFKQHPFTFLYEKTHILFPIQTKKGG